MNNKWCSLVSSHDFIVRPNTLFEVLLKALKSSGVRQANEMNVVGVSASHGVAWDKEEEVRADVLPGPSL